MEFNALAILDISFNMENAQELILSFLLVQRTVSSTDYLALATVAIMKSL
jgi:hypothetical protein